MLLSARQRKRAQHHLAITCTAGESGLPVTRVARQVVICKYIITVTLNINQAWRVAHTNCHVNGLTIEAWEPHSVSACRGTSYRKMNMGQQGFHGKRHCNQIIANKQNNSITARNEPAATSCSTNRREMRSGNSASTESALRK